MRVSARGLVLLCTLLPLSSLFVRGEFLFRGRRGTPTIENPAIARRQAKPDLIRGARHDKRSDLCPTPGPSGTCCPPGYTACSADGVTATCVQTSSDHDNCGQCGVSCGLNSCQGGNCQCNPSDILCDIWGCVDPNTDADNCGGCNNLCVFGCSGGACSCGPPTVSCNGACIIPINDPNNCGSCGNVCPPEAPTCYFTSCTQPICGSPTPDFCPGAGCTDTDTDPQNCGSCGSACATGLSCSGGQCVCLTTSPGYCAASSTCADFDTDLDNCGSCGNECHSSLGSLQGCISGTCGPCVFGDVAQPNYSCDCVGYIGSSGLFGQPPSWCEGECVQISSDINNCGQCGRICSGAFGSGCFMGICL